MKIGVIGAGVSGITFAIKRKMLYPKDEVIVFEHLEKPLKKVLATGNGKCNIGNRKKVSDFHGEEIVKTILNTYDYNAQQEFLNSLFIKTKLIGDLSYPISESAISVRNAFLKAIEKYDVQLVLECQICDYSVIGQKIILKTNKGEYQLDILVFATGGKSSPNLGSDGSIIPLLEKHGYKLKEFQPGLCSIRTKNKIRELDGIRVKTNVKLYDNDNVLFDENGEVLFREHGLSGIVIFNASRVLASLPLKPYKIKIDLLPDVSKEELNQFLKDHNQETLLEAYLHPTLAKVILRSCLKNSEVVDWIKAMTFTFEKLDGFEHAQISVGGILFKDLDNKLGSKIEPVVHFLGELLDYDAPCGGYNLMWAIGTGLFLAERI